MSPVQPWSSQLHGTCALSGGPKTPNFLEVAEILTAPALPRLPAATAPSLSSSPLDGADRTEAGRTDGGGRQGADRADAGSAGGAGYGPGATPDAGQQGDQANHDEQGEPGPDTP
jgi:hypothetical protein